MSIEEASTLRMMPGLARCLYETQNRCDAVYIYIQWYFFLMLLKVFSCKRMILLVVFLAIQDLQLSTLVTQKIRQSKPAELPVRSCDSCVYLHGDGQVFAAISFIFFIFADDYNNLWMNIMTSQSHQWILNWLFMWGTNIWRRREALFQLFSRHWIIIFKPDKHYIIR